MTDDNSYERSRAETVTDNKSTEIGTLEQITEIRVRALARVQLVLFILYIYIYIYIYPLFPIIRIDV